MDSSCKDCQNWNFDPRNYNRIKRMSLISRSLHDQPWWLMGNKRTMAARHASKTICFVHVYKCRYSLGNSSTPDHHVESCGAIWASCLWNSGLHLLRVAFGVLADVDDDARVFLGGRMELVCLAWKGDNHTVSVRYYDTPGTQDGARAPDLKRI